MDKPLKEDIDSGLFSFSALRDKLSWKHGALLLIPAFVLYPRPFLYLLRPVIRRVRRSYRKDTPRLEKLIFSPKRSITAQKAIKSKLHSGSQQNIYIINLFQDNPQPQDATGLQRSVSWNEAFTNDPALYLRAQNAILRVKMLTLQLSSSAQQNFTILLKGNPELLRVVEAKLYGMDSNQYYKIPLFSSVDEIHILQSSHLTNSYEQIITKIKQ